MEGGPSIQHTDSQCIENSNIEEKNICDLGCCDPRRALHRFIVLFFMCLLGFGKIFYYITLIFHVFTSISSK